MDQAAAIVADLIYGMYARARRAGSTSEACAMAFEHAAEFEARYQRECSNEAAYAAAMIERDRKEPRWERELRQGVRDIPAGRYVE